MLQGRLVDLVPYGARFLAQEAAWNNGPGGYLWAMGERWIHSAAQVRAMQAGRRDDAESGDPRVVFGIQAKNGAPIGLFATDKFDTLHRLASLSVIIGDPAYWGQRLGTDAMLLMIGYLFAWRDVRKVWLHTLGFNERVQRQMDRIGGALEARKRAATVADGAWIDVLVYGLRRESWRGYDATADALGLNKGATS